MQMARLDKILADSGFATRSEARSLIKAGRVSVNGSVIKECELKLNPENDQIKLDGKLISSGKVYIMLNKPEGTVSATEDRGQSTVLELLPKEIMNRGVFPVGRLDKDTTGLLIITNDGDFCHEVTSPKHHVPKLYEVYSDGPVSADDVQAFKDGVVLKDGMKCLPADLSADESNPNHSTVRIVEGKYHQVKRMYASRGKPVLKLKRLSIGDLFLDETLKEGEWRELKAEEIKSIFML